MKEKVYEAYGNNRCHVLHSAESVLMTDDTGTTRTGTSFEYECNLDTFEKPSKTVRLRPEICIVLYSLTIHYKVKWIDHKWSSARIIVNN